MAEKIDCTLDDVIEALKSINASDREEWLLAGMAIKSEFGGGGQSVWLDWSSSYPKFKEKEALSVWKSFKKSGIGIGSLFNLALQRGFKFSHQEKSPEEKAAFAAECEARRVAREAEIQLEEEAALRWAGVISQTARDLVVQLKPLGNSPYLGQKRVGAYGIYFAPHSFVIRTNKDFTTTIFSGGDQVTQFFKSRTEDDSFVFFKRGSILIPLRDLNGELQNLQIIFNDGKKKRFLTHGRKSGYFHVIGTITPGSPLIFCEGYATGASIHAATGWPVVVCFDAGNMPVVAALFKSFPNRKLFAGDNDWETAQQEGKKNTGLIKAQEAAAIGGDAWCVPRFDGFSDATGLSDFNDLHVAAGLEFVLMQLQEALNNWIKNGATVEPSSSFDAPPDYGDIPAEAYEDYEQSDLHNGINHEMGVRKQAKGGKTVFSIQILLERFNFIVQDGSVWDTETESIIKKIAFNDLVGKSLAEEWRAHSERIDINAGEIQAIKIKRARELREARYSQSERWKLKFTYNERGEIKSDIGNARLVLEFDEEWKGVIAYCQFSYRVLKRKAPPFPNGSEGEWSDADTDRFRIWLNEKYRFTPKTADALGAIVVTAEANGFHPVREYLKGIEWDGELRLDRWLTTYLGAESTLYNSLVGRMFLIGAIARVMQPPVKMDNVLIFEGLQGLGKSTALRILSDPWFTDTPLVLGDKDGFQQMQGVWIIELAELDSFNRAEHTRAKQFFGSQTDRFRPSYGRMTVTFPRQCVFAGTTNQAEYLRDATGNRRYWPVKCSAMNALDLQRDRDQLWAEAFAAYQAGDKWWPSDAHKSIFEDQQERRFEADVWEELIDKWLLNITRNRVMMHEIMEEALGLEASQMKPPEQKRVGQIMAHLNWVKVRARVGGGRETAYERPVATNMAA